MLLQRKGRPITPEALDWIHALHRQGPTAYGYTAETWTITLLASHIRSDCRAAGHPCLSDVTYGLLSRLLASVPCTQPVGRSW
jgi:hypothetical protein